MEFWFALTGSDGVWLFLKKKNNKHCSVDGSKYQFWCNFKE